MIENTITNLGIAIVVAVASWIGRQGYNNRKEFKRFFKAIKYNNEKIRLSVAYLFKIKIGDKYLLIEGKRINQYQPVGGVYKTFESFSGIKKELKIVSDDSIKTDKAHDTSLDYDLRICLPANNLVKFINWFKSKKNREYHVFREFYEELLETDIISNFNISTFNPEYINTVISDIRYSKQFSLKEVLIFDIFEIKLDEESVSQIISKLECSNNIVLATEADIEKECIFKNNLSKKIGWHSKFII